MSQLSVLPTPLRAAVSAAVLMVLALSAGCSVQSAEVPNPYAAEIEQAREEATTDLQRAVLEDGKVTDAEFSEVAQDAARCVADRGYLMTVTDSGYELTMPNGEGFASEADGEAATQAQSECIAERMGWVESLYDALRQNPERQDAPTLLADCLVRAGVVDAPFSGHDYDEAIMDPPWDPEDPRVRECSMDPRGRTGALREDSSPGGMEPSAAPAAWKGWVAVAVST